MSCDRQRVATAWGPVVCQSVVKSHTHTPPPLGLKVIRVWWYWVHFSSYTFLAFLTMYLYFFSFNVTWGDLNLLSHNLPDLSESSLSRTSL